MGREEAVGGGRKWGKWCRWRVEELGEHARQSGTRSELCNPFDDNVARRSRVSTLDLQTILDKNVEKQPQKQQPQTQTQTAVGFILSETKQRFERRRRRGPVLSSRFLPLT
uniref:Uncharacterized protein n=1 Tax=Vespula pensylvanica TaxID=30213 RepID=A0A834U9D7_VESPE|nr:hypothetical protein H0235_008752 [Vespula pensylvanica]